MGEDLPCTMATLPLLFRITNKKQQLRVASSKRRIAVIRRFLHPNIYTNVYTQLRERVLGLTLKTYSLSSFF